MVFIGWALAVLGVFGCLFSGALSLRAAPESPVKIWDVDPVAPHAGWMQVIGVLLVIVGGALLDQPQKWVLAPFLVFNFLIWVGMRAAHNRRVAGLDF